MATKIIKTKYGDIGMSYVPKEEEKKSFGQFNLASALSALSASLTKPPVVPFPAPEGEIMSKIPQQQTKSPSTSSYTVPETEVPFRNEAQATNAGYYGEEAAKKNIQADTAIFNQPSVKTEKILSSAESKKLGSQFGNENLFSGMSVTEASRKVEELKRKLKEQTSALTSYTPNLNAVAGTKKNVDNLRVQVDNINNDSWVSNEEKKIKKDALLGSYASQIAGLFKTPEDFQLALQSPEYQKSFQQFESLGGDVGDIASKVSQSPTTEPEENVQSLDQYLGALSTPEQQRAYETLLPEGKLAQDEIVFEQSIPEEYKKFYFGTPEQIGIQKQKKEQAQAEQDLLEKKQELDKENLKAQADYAIQRNNNDLAIADAEIEENRLHAQNYITGMLAKLGALNTTSSAPIAIANLNQKYQKQSQELRSKVKNQNKELELKLKEAVDAVDIDTQDKILGVQKDLTKSDEEALKEIMKLKTTADRNTFNIINKFATSFRTLTEAYRKEAKRDAEKYTKDYLENASMYDVDGLSFNDFINKKQAAQRQTFGVEKRQSLIPEFLQNIISSGSISSQLENVLSGKKNLADYSATNRVKIQKEMERLGITKDMIGKAEEEGTSGFGKLSNADLTKGLNYILMNKGTKEDQEKFKTDRAFQAYVMSLI